MEKSLSEFLKDDCGGGSTLEYVMNSGYTIPEIDRLIEDSQAKIIARTGPKFLASDLLKMAPFRWFDIEFTGDLV